MCRQEAVQPARPCPSLNLQCVSNLAERCHTMLVLCIDSGRVFPQRLTEKTMVRHRQAAALHWKSGAFGKQFRLEWFHVSPAHCGSNHHRITLNFEHRQARAKAEGQKAIFDTFEASALAAIWESFYSQPFEDTGGGRCETGIWKPPPNNPSIEDIEERRRFQRWEQQCQT